MIKLTLIALTILTTACAGNETKPQEIEPQEAKKECPESTGPTYVNQWVYPVIESEKDSFGVLGADPYEFFNSDRPSSEG